MSSPTAPVRYNSRVVLEGQYRTSCGISAYRLVYDDRDVLTVEVEAGRDAMSQIVWKGDQNFCGGSAGLAILLHLCDRAGLLKPPAREPPAEQPPAGEFILVGGERRPAT